MLEYAEEDESSELWRRMLAWHGALRTGLPV